MKNNTSETNASIYVVVTEKGKSVPFVTGDLASARQLAREIGGKRHRGITVIPPDHRLYAGLKKELGL
jgi:hypothetical protein